MATTGWLSRNYAKICLQIEENEQAQKKAWEDWNKQEDALKAEKERFHQYHLRLQDEYAKLCKDKMDVEKQILEKALAAGKGE